MSKLLTLAAAAALLAGAAASAAAQMPRDPGAAANVRQSQQYEQLLRTNPSFRAKRIQQECGPIADPQEHEECVASFPPAGRPVMRHH